MSLASNLRDRVANAGNHNLEFGRDGYRLSLNPIEDRYDELGFILWREDADGGSAPIATGRAVGDDLVLDGAPAAGGELVDLEAAIASLIAGDPIAEQAAHGNEQAIPAGG